jgi:hypothetical protein
VTDPFAAAAAQSAGAVSTAPPTSIPADSGESAAVVASVADFGGIADPFLTDSQVNTGGAGGPRCNLADALGRLVVMVPKKFIEKSRKAERFRKNADDLYQPVADVDFVVLDGGPFTFTYKEKDGDNEVYCEFTAEELPYIEKDKRLFSAGLAWSIKRCMDQRGLYFGVVSYGPANRRSGGDIDTVTAAMQAWEKAGKRGESPRHTYVLDERSHVLTPERRAIAGAWWAEYRKTL